MAEVLQFEILSDLDALMPQKIDTNFEAVKSGLESLMAPYTTMAVTEDGIGDAKKTLAQLRKLKDGINTQKIAVKKEWMAPYTEFEDQAKQLMGIVDKGVVNLDGQIKAYDEERKAEKQRKIKEILNDAVSGREIEGYLSYDDVWNPKWLNAGYPIDTIADEIGEAAAKTAEDLDFLRGLHSEFEAAVLDEYSRSHDLKAAMNTASRLKAIQSAENDAREREAVRQAETPEATGNESTDAPAPSDGHFEPSAPPVRQFIKTGDEPPAPKLYSLTFQFVMTAQQARALKAFLDEQGINYHKL